MDLTENYSRPISKTFSHSIDYSNEHWLPGTGYISSAALTIVQTKQKALIKVQSITESRTEYRSMDAKLMQCPGLGSELLLEG